MSSAAGKPVQVACDGGRLTSDAGVLVLAEIDRRLGVSERLARCLKDPRMPARVEHSIAEMIRFRILLIAAGYPDANDCGALRSDPAFKLAVGRLPESGPALCSQPTMSRLENLPGPTALKRMMAAMVELFCDSFAAVPRRIVLDIDDTAAPVHGRQELARFHAHHGGHCFLPIHLYEATTGKPVAVILLVLAGRPVRHPSLGADQGGGPGERAAEADQGVVAWITDFSATDSTRARWGGSIWQSRRRPSRRNRPKRPRVGMGNGSPGGNREEEEAWRRSRSPTRRTR